MVKYQNIPSLNAADSIVDTDKLIIEKNTASDATKYSKAEKLKVYIPVKNHYGEVITSALPIEDDTLHLLDGSQLSSTDYPEFYNYMSNLYTASPTASYFSQPIEKIKNNFTAYNGPTVENGQVTITGAGQYIRSNKGFKLFAAGPTYARGNFYHLKVTFYPTNLDGSTKTLFTLVEHDTNVIKFNVTMNASYGVSIHQFDPSGTWVRHAYGLSNVFSNNKWYTLYLGKFHYTYSTVAGKFMVDARQTLSSSDSTPSSSVGAYLYYDGETSGCEVVENSYDMCFGHTFNLDGSIRCIIDTSQTYLMTHPTNVRAYQDGTQEWIAYGTGLGTCEEGWQDEYATYGVVGRYAYDANSVIRIPKINNVKEYVNSDASLGSISQINYTSGSEKLTTMKQYNYVVVK